MGLSVIEVRGICVGVTIYIIPRFLPHTYPHDHSRLPATLCHGPWPLHLVLTERNLECYNRVFRFLLSVKRTQLALHKTWAKQVSEERER